MHRNRLSTPTLALAGALSLAAAPAALAETVSHADGAFKLESLAKLDNPWGMVFLPDQRLLISEKAGKLRIFADGKLSEPIKGVPEVEHHGQGGLLDLTVDPNFERNQLIYFSYSEASEEQPDVEKDEKDPRLGEFQDLDDTVLKGLAVARGRLDGDQLQDVQVIWRQVPKQIGRGHFGGRLIFAPDGQLFITSGDRQRFEPAQERTSNIGKIVRINADGTIPKDNPFVGQKDVQDDVYTSGHRNPLGAAIHPDTGQLWTHEMGPEGGDEVNIIQAGQNYGWPIVSSGLHYDDTPVGDYKDHPEFTQPLYAWDPAISPSGLIFYTGNVFGHWKGKAVLGGMGSETLVVLTLDGNKVADDEIIDVGFRIRDVMQTPDGHILFLRDGDDGALLRATPTEAEAG
jgi:aldose sugar dehydrogenase